MQLRDTLDRVQLPNVVDEFFKLAQTELTDLDLPTSWEQLHEQLQNTFEPPVVEAITPLEEEEVILTPEALLGERILALCFDKRFDELQILHNECLRNNLAWEVDWFRRAPDRNTAFNIAARLAGDGFLRVACMELLIALGAGGTINELDSDGYTALLRFVLINDSLCAKFLLRQEGLNLEVETEEGRTALFLAAETRNIHIARDLLRCGAYLHTSCHTGQTVLMAIAMRTELDQITAGELVRNLTFWLDAGVDIEVPDGQAAWRAIHYAAAARYDPGAVALHALLRRGAQVGALTRFEQTPLLLAVCFGNLEAIRVLVAAEGMHPSIPFESEEKLVLSEGNEPRRDEILAVLKAAQAWERRKGHWRASLLEFWQAGGPYVGVGLGMGLIALLLRPMQAFFARLQQ